MMEHEKIIGGGHTGGKGGGHKTGGDHTGGGTGGDHTGGGTGGDHTGGAHLKDLGPVEMAMLYGYSGA